MAEINPPNLLVMGIFATISFSFIVYHCYKFDRFRCLLPSRKDWFRVLLTYMLIGSNMCLIAWAGAWAYCKYQLGWVRITGIGARPWPSALFPPPFDQYNPPLTALLGICYASQASLNAEEALYWYHLMRAVRNPSHSTPWLGSRYFYAWIVISIIVTVAQLSVPWMGNDGNLQVQLSKELLTGGALEFIVLCAATTIVYRFPRFLREVAASGAGPEVQARLHYYHQLNKVRNFFRYTFTAPLFILGGDGLTKATKINLNALAGDFLAATTVGSLCIVMMISIILYLPRTKPSAAHYKVMVGMPMATRQQAVSGFALMSLLREGGQWEGLDDDLGGQPDADERGVRGDAPFANAAEARGQSWNMGEEKRQGPMPLDIANFTSPIAVSAEPQPRGPVAIHIQVEREVMRD